MDNCAWVVKRINERIAYTCEEPVLPGAHLCMEHLKLLNRANRDYYQVLLNLQQEVSKWH